MTRALGENEVLLPLQVPRVVLETAVLLGADRRALLAGTGIDEGAFSTLDSRVSFEQYGILVDNALRLTGEPRLGLIAGRNLGSVQLGLFGFALMTSPSIGQALDAWFRHVRVVSPAWDPALEIRGSTACLVLRERVFRGERRTFATELLLSALEAHGRALLGSELPLLALQVAYPRPPHAHTYAEFTSIAVEFDAPVTEVHFDAALLERPVAFADPATHRLAAHLAALQPGVSDLPSRCPPPPPLARWRRAGRDRARTRAFDDAGGNARLPASGGHLISRARRGMAGASRSRAGDVHPALRRRDGRSRRFQERAELPSRLQAVDRKVAGGGAAGQQGRTWKARWRGDLSRSRVRRRGARQRLPAASTRLDSRGEISSR